MKLHFTFYLTLATIIFASCTPWSALQWYNSKQHLTPLPAASLSGKIILIDPGHGNNTSGAIGKYGTKEGDVNLAVARILKILLQEQGATVYMTRYEKKTNWWREDLTNREDLYMRSTLRDSLIPDLFVSLHHNGTTDDSRDTNVAKIFYAMDDVGASLDVAQFINMEFSELLGLGKSQLLSGNYFILRNPKVPSLICEPSYLSHPTMERKLHDSAALKWEANVYFRGIVKWFASGVPKITGFTVDSTNGTITALISSEVPLDTLLTNLFFNNTRLDGKVHKNGYTAAIPSPLMNCKHIFRCIAGNVNGNLSTFASFTYSVNRPVNTLTAAVDKQPNKCLSCLRITALDFQGYPVQNGTPVIRDNQDTAQTENGIALFYIPVMQTIDSVEITCGDVITHTIIPAGSNNSLPPIQGFISSADTNFKASGCLLKIAETFYTPDRNGFFSINSIDTSTEIHASFSSKGFFDSTVILSRSKVNFIKLEPHAHGILIGKKIVIDPEFGGAESGGISISGIRACDINRKISNTTATLLENFGCKVILVRPEDRTIHTTERLSIAENNDADIYILIRSDSLQQLPYISFFPFSISGKKVADKLNSQWYKKTGNSAAVYEEPSYIMQQTRCPAVTVSLNPLNSKDPLNHKNSHNIANAVLDGLIDFYSETSVSTFSTRK